MPSEDRSREYTDEFGITGPLPVTAGVRAIPDEGFPSGPEVGERLPDIVLQSSTGGRLDVHHDRHGSKACVVFFRSAVW